MYPTSVPFRKQRHFTRDGFRREWALALCLCTFSATWLFPPSAAASGEAVFSCLEIDEAARPVSMAGAYTALADDVHAIHWNPAGLGKFESQQLLVSYLNYLMDVKAGSLGYAGGGWGFSLAYLNYGPIPVDLGLDPSGTSFAMTYPYDLAMTVGYGGRLTEGIWAGGSLKGIQESILGYAAQGVGFDLGLQFDTRVWVPLSWGICLKDLGQQTKAFRGERRRLPARLAVGVAIPVVENEFTLALDGVYALDRPGLAVACGAEYNWNGLLQARAGYRSEGADLNSGSGLDALNGLSFGLGFRLWGCQLDYAFVPFNVLGNTHRVSLALTWGARTAPLPAAPAKRSHVAPPASSGVSWHPTSAARTTLTPSKTKPKTLKSKKTKSKKKNKAKIKKTTRKKKAAAE